MAACTAGQSPYIFFGAEGTTFNLISEFPALVTAYYGSSSYYTVVTAPVVLSADPPIVRTVIRHLDEPDIVDDSYATVLCTGPYVPVPVVPTGDPSPGVTVFVGAAMLAWAIGYVLGFKVRMIRTALNAA